MDWDDDYHTKEEEHPTTRLGSGPEAMGSPMGTQDGVRSQVAGEEECRRSTTPGTESQRDPDRRETEERETGKKEMEKWETKMQ